MVNTLWNYGTISGGTFKENIFNFGQISYGDFKKYVSNQANSTISGGIFEGQIDNNGTISGGIFLQTNPSNAKSLTLTNATIDGTGGAVSANVVPGTSVSITAPQTLSNLPFSKWNVTGGTLQLANTASVTFAMPTADTAIEAAYKEILHQRHLQLLLQLLLPAGFLPTRSSLRIAMGR
jgi:hypothetical protein